VVPAAHHSRAARRWQAALCAVKLPGGLLDQRVEELIAQPQVWEVRELLKERNVWGTMPRYLNRYERASIAKLCASLSKGLRGAFITSSLAELSDWSDAGLIGFESWWNFLEATQHNLEKSVAAEVFVLALLWGRESAPQAQCKLYQQQGVRWWDPKVVLQLEGCGEDIGKRVIEADARGRIALGQELQELLPKELQGADRLCLGMREFTWGIVALANWLYPPAYWVALEADKAESAGLSPTRWPRPPRQVTTPLEGFTRYVHSHLSAYSEATAAIGRFQSRRRSIADVIEAKEAEKANRRNSGANLEDEEVVMRTIVLQRQPLLQLFDYYTLPSDECDVVLRNRNRATELLWDTGSEWDEGRQARWMAPRQFQRLCSECGITPTLVPPSQCLHAMLEGTPSGQQVVKDFTAGLRDELHSSLGMDSEGFLHCICAVAQAFVQKNPMGKNPVTARKIVLDFMERIFCKAPINGYLRLVKVK